MHADWAMGGALLDQLFRRCMRDIDVVASSLDGSAVLSLSRGDLRSGLVCDQSLARVGGVERSAAAFREAMAAVHGCALGFD